MSHLQWFPNNVVLTNNYSDRPGFNMDSPIYPPRPRDFNMNSSVRPQRGHRRGNTISSYHHPLPFTYKKSWKRSDWDDIHLPNYEDYSDTEYDRPRSPPRGHPYQNYQENRFNYNTNNCEQYSISNQARNRNAWRNDRRTPRSISHNAPTNFNTRKLTDQFLGEFSPKNDDSNKTNVKKTVSETFPPVSDNLDVTKNNDVTKKTSTDEVTREEGNEAQPLMETIPLLLGTKKRSASTDPIDRPKTPIDDLTNLSMEIEDPESPNAKSPVKLKEKDKAVDGNTAEVIIDIDDTEEIIDLENTPELDMAFSPRDRLGTPKKNNIEIRMNVQISSPKSDNKSPDKDTVSLSPNKKNDFPKVFEIRMDDKSFTSKIVMFKSPLQTDTNDTDVVPVQLPNEASNIIDLSEDSNDNTDIVIPTAELTEINKELEMENAQLINIRDSIETELRLLTAEDEAETVENSESVALGDNHQKSLEKETTLKRKERCLSGDDVLTKRRKTSKKSSSESKEHKTTNIQNSSTLAERNTNVEKTSHEKKRIHNDSSKSTTEKFNEKCKRSDYKGKTKSSNKKHETNSKKSTNDHKESKTSRIDKRRHSSAKNNDKRRSSCQDKDFNQRRNSCGANAISTCIPEPPQDSKDSTDSSVIEKIASSITDTDATQFATILETLRKNESYLNIPNPEIQSAVDNSNIGAIVEKQPDVYEFNDTEICDKEVNEITTQVSTGSPAKVRNIRGEMYERSKSTDYQDVSSTCHEKPAKITKRRRTIVDASELNITRTTRRSRSRSRPGSRNCDNYNDDPDFKMYFNKITITPARITRSKSRESRSNSTDALVPKSPDPDFYQQSTPPATPKTPRQGDNTPEILRNLHMKSRALASSSSHAGLEMDEVSQNINHVYAPSLGLTYDFSSRPNDPRLQKISTTKMPITEDDFNYATVVDEITLQNTLANKSVASNVFEEDMTPVVDDTISPRVVQEDEDPFRTQLRIKLEKLTNKDIKAEKKKLARRKTKKVQPHQDKNKIPCSIAISAIGIPVLSQNNNNNDNAHVVDEIIKLLDATGPRSTKESEPPIRKSIDQLENNTLSVDNAITKPFSNKTATQPTSSRPFDTFATVSPNSGQTSRPQPSRSESKETKIKRLFGPENTPIYYNLSEELEKKRQQNKKIKISNPTNSLINMPFVEESIEQMEDFVKDVQQNKKIKVVYPTNSLINMPFVEESIEQMQDFEKDVVQGTLLNQEEYLHRVVILQNVQSQSEMHCIKSMPEHLDESIMNVDDVFANDDVGNLSINGEPPEGIDIKITDTVTSSAPTKTYSQPTVVATIDLLAKEEESSSIPIVLDSPPTPPPAPIQQDSIMIVPVDEYVRRVISIIGQFVQMEKVYWRFVDIMCKQFTSFRLETVCFDDLVDDFKKAFILRLGTIFTEYNDSIEIQDFSANVLYSKLTQANLKYNGFKIKTIDVVNAICELHKAVGQSHKRSTFCNQLFQLSCQIKGSERMSADNDRNENRNNSCANSTVIQKESNSNPIVESTVNADLISNNETPSPSNFLINSVPTSVSVPTLPVATPIVVPSIVVQPNILPPATNSSDFAQVHPVSTLPVITSNIHPVSALPVITPNIPDVQCCQAQQQAICCPVTQHCQAQSKPDQFVASRSQSIAFVPQHGDNLTNVIDSVAQNASSAYMPGLSHDIVISQGRQTTTQNRVDGETQNRRRIKHTPTLQQQELERQIAQQRQQDQPMAVEEQNALPLILTTEMRSKIYEHCRVYNNFVNNYYALTGGIERPWAKQPMNTPTSSNNSAITTSPVSNPRSQVNSGKTQIRAPPPPYNMQTQQPGWAACNTFNQDALALKNYRPYSSKKKNRTEINTVAVPSATVAAVSNNPVQCPRITVRNIEMLRRQPVTLESLLDYSDKPSNQTQAQPSRINQMQAQMQTQSSLTITTMQSQTQAPVNLAAAQSSLIKKVQTTAQMQSSATFSSTQSSLINQMQTTTQMQSSTNISAVQSQTQDQGNRTGAQTLRVNQVQPQTQAPTNLIVAQSSVTINQVQAQIQRPRQGSLTDRVIQVMIDEIDETATQSCILANANNIDRPQQLNSSGRMRSNSNGDDTNSQTDPIAPRNLSRDSGNSSVAVGDESLAYSDFSCICGKTADMLCSCKLIVYCSASCQAKDWKRHAADHVES